MYRTDMQVWAATLTLEPASNTNQRETIDNILWDKGWLVNTPIAAQDLNQLFHLTTGAILNETLDPADNLSDVASATTSLTNLGGVTATQVVDLMYPIGSIYTRSGNSENPATTFGIGTWAAFGAGRVMIGVGQGTDDRSESLTFSDTVEGGEYKHILTPNEMPSHTHSLPSRSGDTTGNGGIADGIDGVAKTANTGSVGVDLPHNNIQPYIVVFMWLRTA